MKEASDDCLFADSFRLPIEPPREDFELKLEMHSFLSYSSRDAESESETLSMSYEITGLSYDMLTLEHLLVGVGFFGLVRFACRLLSFWTSSEVKSCFAIYLVKLYNRYVKLKLIIQYLH